MEVEQLTGPIAGHGEGPVWSPSWGGLRWVDMTAGEILSFDEHGEVQRRGVGAAVAAVVRPRRRGGAVIGVERGFALEEPDGSINQLPELWSEPGVRMNEGACDPDGRFYCGSMAYEKTKGAASLYRLDAACSVSVVLDRVTVSNGLDWTPDGRKAYYNDTDTHAVSVFAYDAEHGLTDRHLFVEIAGGGRPDGLTVDAEGGVWTAIVNRGAVHCYSPHGELLEVIELPVQKVTACAFGGEQLDTLFITTSREGLRPGEDPKSGSLFAARPGVRGIPVREFAG
jgi:sugar lactone lactonase YvrE